MGRSFPFLLVTSLVENITIDVCSLRQATQSRHPGGPGLLEAHTNASQLRNSSQHTLRSSCFAWAPSNELHMSTRLKTVAKLLIPILQLFKQIKCSHELDHQEFSYKGENHCIPLRYHTYSFQNLKVEGRD